MTTRRDVLVAGGAGLIVATGSGRALAQAASGAVLRVASSLSPTTLDPVTGRGGSDHVSLYPFYDTLVEFDEQTLKPLPGLAASWAYPDPETLILKLRPGVVFHDGTPFDAVAVKFNLDRAASHPRSSIQVDVGGIKSVEVTGPLEVTLHLKRADSSIPLTLSDRAGMMASPTAIKKLGDEHDRNPVGTGPWRLVEFRPGDKLTAVRNPNYWKPGLPRIPNLQISYILDLNTCLRTVVSGSNDFTYNLSSVQAQAAESMSSVVLTRTATIGNMWHVWMNNGRPPFNDVRVRQALLYSIDKRAYNRVTQRDQGEIATGLYPKAYWGYDPGAANAYPFDLAKSKTLLAEAGRAGGVDVVFRVFPDQFSQQSFEVLSAMAAKAGIRLKPVSGGTPGAVADSFFRDGEGDMMMGRWSGRPDPSVAFATLYAKGSYFNPGSAEAPGFQDALVKSLSVEDPASRAQLLRNLQQIVNDFAQDLPLVFEPLVAVHSKRVKNYATNLLGKPRFEKVTLAE
jgi:ABC-type transport system substrate-binding protein